MKLNLTLKEVEAVIWCVENFTMADDGEEIKQCLGVEGMKAGYRATEKLKKAGYRATEKLNDELRRLRDE